MPFADQGDPAGETLPLDRWQLRLLPAADLFMLLMWSKPPSGTLRTTRVTLVTIILGVAITVTIGLPSLLLAGYAVASGSPLLLLVALPCLLLASGATVVAVFGVRQRLLLRRAAAAG